MEIRLYFQMLKRGWWIILLTALVAVAVSLGISMLVSPQYQAVARFIISPATNDPTRPDLTLQGLQTLDRQSVITTYAEVINSDRILNDALLYLQMTRDDIKNYTINATVLASSSVIELSVTGPDRRIAADIANTMGNQAINFIRRLNQAFNVDFLDVASLPVEPYSPQPLRDASLALVLGLVGGALLAILREQLMISIEVFRQRLHIDGETGLFTRKHFIRLVEDEVFEKPEETFSIGIVELSVYGSQDIIESYPSALLQKILRQVTDRLRGELRGTDAIGRWGTTSFAVLLYNTPGSVASRLFERICQSISGPVDTGQFGLTITLNSVIGVTEYSGSGSAQELFEKTTKALEQAHRNKTSPVCVL